MTVPAPSSSSSTPLFLPRPAASDVESKNAIPPKKLRSYALMGMHTPSKKPTQHNPIRALPGSQMSESQAATARKARGIETLHRLDAQLGSATSDEDVPVTAKTFMEAYGATPAPNLPSSGNIVATSKAAADAYAAYGIPHTCAYLKAENNNSL